MKDAYAFGRLLWRPGLFWLKGIILVLAAACLPWIAGNDPGGTLEWLRLSAVSRDAVRALWRDTVLVPGLFGFIAARAAVDLRSKPFGAMLPGMRTAMLRGAIALGVVVSLAVALVRARFEGSATATTAFAVALVSYGTPCLPVLAPGILGILAFAPVVPLLVLVAPSLLISVEGSQPVLLAATAVLSAGYWFARLSSQVPSVEGPSAEARAANDLWGEERDATARSFFRWLFPPPLSYVDRPWRRSLAGDRNVDWSRAAAYERDGFYPPRWPQVAGLAMVLFVLSAMGAVNMLVGIPLWLTIGPAPLSGGFAYPISRARRAEAEFWSSLGRNTTLCLLAAVIALPTYSALAPLRTRFGWDDAVGATPAAILLQIGVGFILAPVLQLTWIRGRTFWTLFRHNERAPQLTSRAKPIGAKAWSVGFVSWIACFVITTLLAMRGARDDVPHAIPLAVVLAIGSQMAYWVALRRDAARSDFA